ncbi:MAG: arylsulfatase, partial [Deltaproteobacteria bacterium]|nr:arylsulfatase [Deltaproteobacteria bacterium]
AAPKIYAGIPQLPVEGISMVYTWENAGAASRHTSQFYQMAWNRGAYKNGWAAVTRHKRGIPFPDDHWALFNLKEDFSQAHDVADRHPEKVRELKDFWWAEAGRMNATTLVDKGMATTRYVPPVINRNVFTYYPDMSHLTASATPPTRNRSYTITVPVERSGKQDEGVLVAFGNHHSGYVLYVKDNRLVHEYNFMANIVSRGASYRVQSDLEVPVGKSELQFEFKKTGRFKGNGILYINGRKVGEVIMSHTLPRKISHEGLDIGRDTLTQVGHGYEGEFPFSGTIENVVFKLEDDRK